jgi:hypothetical protein
VIFLRRPPEDLALRSAQDEPTPRRRPGPVGPARILLPDGQVGGMSLLRQWADDSARIYPMVIRIDKIIVDEWNRRRIEAVTAEGRKELIVCDKAVEPGGTYFMYPPSNPFRVDPILIEFNP